MSEAGTGDAEQSGVEEAQRHQPPAGFLRRIFRNRWVGFYLALLVLSHVVIAVWNPKIWHHQPAATSGPPTQIILNTTIIDPSGPTPREGLALSLWHWPAANGAPARNHPVFLLHGSPSGGGRDFSAYAPALAQAGFSVYALDRPGFGDSTAWVPSYSLPTNAHALLQAMDKLSVAKAHIVGWSQGGGGAIWAAHLAPERTASLTLLGSVGIQEGEGSGDYHFEHAKYAIGYAGLVVLPELLPHFNLLGQRAMRHAFVRDFWDSDQRPIRDILTQLATPTLIVHGRHDPLVPAWVAEEHHRLLANSRLVMLDDSHFFVLNGKLTSPESVAIATHAQTSFLARHDAGDAPALQGIADFAPVPPAKPTTLLGYEISTKAAPWWVSMPIIAVGTLVSEDLTVVITSLLVASHQLDLGVGFIALMIGILVGDLGLWLIGRVFGRRLLRVGFFRKRISERMLTHWQKMLDQHTAKAVLLTRCLPGTRLPLYIAAGMLGRRTWAFVFWFTVAVMIWTPVVMILTALVGPPMLSFFREVFHAPIAIVLSLMVLMLLIKLVSYEVTPGGRKLLRSDLRRMLHPEFWPIWLFYAPLLPWLIVQSIKHRGPMTLTCLNPGIEQGGGIVGESKIGILRDLTDAKQHAGITDDELIVLHAELIPPDPDPAKRAQRALNLIDADPKLNGFPVILKPDASQRGKGLRVARTAEDVQRYFQAVEAPVQLQRFHPGPCEAGIMWTRRPERGLGTGPAGTETTGAIFSITRKTFPVLVGDGEHTIEQLIWNHPRHSLQPRIFLDRFADRLGEIPAAGETIRLAQAGNHAQGTMFTDGSELITAELTVLIDRLARSFAPDASGLGSLDFGRFDLRYTSDEELAAGRGLAIIELNGTFAESTNIYDPRMPLRLVYQTLYRQWATIFAIGLLRRRAGQKPMSLLRFLRMVTRDGSAGAGLPVAD